MTIESVTHISDLNSAYPANTDAMSEGDNHIRNIKTALLATFPNITGAVTPTHTELNFVDGVTSSIQTQLNALDNAVTALQSTLPAPAGTKLTFFQAAAPTGWTQDTANNNCMLRVVNTAGGGTGGSDSPILMDKVPSHTHTADVTDPGHRHSITKSNTGSGTGAVADSENVSPPANETTAIQIATTGITVSVNANGSAANWTPKYLDMIICSKDA